MKIIVDEKTAVLEVLPLGKHICRNKNVDLLLGSLPIMPIIRLSGIIPRKACISLPRADYHQSVLLFFHPGVTIVKGMKEISKAPMLERCGMDRGSECLLSCLISIILLAGLWSAAMAQTGLPRFIHMWDILVEDFECVEIPYCYGWMQDEPNYVSSFGCATVSNIVFDTVKQSRVLDVYNPSSAFLLGPLPRLWKSYDLTTPSFVDPLHTTDGISMGANGIISFDLRMPLGADPQKSFELNIVGEDATGERDISIRLVPSLPSDESFPGTKITLDAAKGITAVVTGLDPGNKHLTVTVGIGSGVIDGQNDMTRQLGFFNVTVGIGSGVIDGSWHTIRVNLADAVKKSVDACEGISNPNDWYMTRANTLFICAYIFRLDNIIFRSNRARVPMYDPFLFRMDALYPRISKPCRYLFIADYKTDDEVIKVSDLLFDPNNFLFVRDPNDPNDPVVKYWTDLGADPNLFGKEADPSISDILDRDFTVDLNLPVFADPNLRMTPEGPGPMAKRIIDSGPLGWNGTVVKYNPEPTSIDYRFDIPGVLNPLCTYPYDGMPTYLPAYYSAIEAIEKWGRPYFSPDSVSILEGALWNAGIWLWPNIAYFDYSPQEFEELCLTIEVTNGVQYDTGEVPITVVNYPLENYAPVSQLPDEELIFYVGEVGAHHITFIDPDCFIFSMSETPLTDHIPGSPVNEDFRRDMDDLVWDIATVDGVTISSYPDNINNAGIDMNDWDFGGFGYTGLLTLEPEYEGTHNMVVRCQDAMGGTGIAELGILFVSRSDRDSDYIYDYLDNCPDTRNTDQADTDQDDLGDACDPCPFDPNSDGDGDGVCVSEGDCNDNDAAIYPGAPELCDGKDNDCDGVIPSDEVDADADGWLACDDCDDQDSSVYPGAPGTHAEKDNNCNGMMDNDEKKRSAQGSLYPGYFPAVSPWVQTLPYSNLNYQLPLTATWSPMQYPVSPQQMWYSGYPSTFNRTQYLQNIFQSGPFQFPFIRSDWTLTYIQPWFLIQNQLP